MTVDNTLYNRPGDIWWDETAGLSMLRTALNPARFGYFRSVLTERLHINPYGKATLDVGCRPPPTATGERDRAVRR